MPDPRLITAANRLAQSTHGPRYLRFLATVETHTIALLWMHEGRDEETRRLAGALYSWTSAVLHAVYKAAVEHRGGTVVRYG